MSRSVSNDFRQIHKLIFGYSDPSNLQLKIRSNGKYVYCDFSPQKYLVPHIKTAPNGLILSLFEDLSHAALAHQEGHIALIRECKMHILAPIYTHKSHIALVNIPRKESGNIMRAQLKLQTDAKKTICEAELELFILGAEQIRRMLPDGRIPQPLQHFFQKKRV